MKEKKIVTIILLFIVLIGVSTISNAADTYTATTQTSEGLTVNWNYQLEGDNIVNLVCTNISEISGKVDIPSSIEGRNVLSIGSEAFKDCYGLTDITFPNTITSIGKEAFYKCTGLKNVIIPDKVTSLGTGAFAYCSGLQTITLSKNLTSLNYEVFYGCTGITTLEIPNKVTTIFGQVSQYGTYVYNDKGGAFAECKGLKTIILPNSISVIEEKAFYGVDMKNVTIYGNEGSFAEQYAKTNGIKFDLISNYGKPNEEKPGNENNTPSEENKDNYQGEQNIGNDKKPNEGLANSGGNTPQNGQDVGTTGNNGKITGKDQTTANTILPKTGQSFAIILGIVFIISVGVFVYIKYNKYRDI